MNVYGGSSGYVDGISGSYTANIVIESGTINAWGGASGAGIGVREKNAKITINSGEVNATGGEKAAGIGGNYVETCGTITINGGIVTATPGSSTSSTYPPAAIGGGQGLMSAMNSTVGASVININGGRVYANGTIGGQEGKASGSVNSFSTSGDGAAVIRATSIVHKENQNNWSGIFLKGRKAMPTAVHLPGCKRTWLYKKTKH